MKTIFVSSTFRDMHYERDIIHERVTPALNHAARQYGESVSFCDLRWGVNTSDLESEEGSRKVLSVCLEEIDRCRPYMLVILGYRYGWIPSTDLIANAADRTAFMIDDLEQSVTALEIEYGALSNPEQMEHTLFYFREFEDEIPEIYRSEDDYHAEKLHALKERIRKLAGGRLKTYTLGWDDREGRPCGLEAFAEMVESDLKALMEAEWQQTAALTPFQRDQLSQWDYAAGKVRQFSARENFITTCINKLDDDTNLLALRGESGTGKSTLMARLAYALKERGDKALPIFCSTTPLCNDGTDLIRYLADFLETELREPHFADMEQKEKPGIKEWTDRLAELAEIYSSRGEKRLVILIDAVDQLFADEVRDQLRFIPYSLTNRVQMVLSCLSDYHLGRSMDCVIAEPLVEDDRPEIIRGILRAQGRELDGQVVSAIVQKPAAKSPLYLSLLIQRLLMMNKDDFEEISAHGDGMDAITRHQTGLVKHCSDTLEGVCVDIINAASDRLGGAFVRKAVQYLAVSRHGLRESDLEALLSVGSIRWSALDFARFVQYLSAFFILRDDGRCDFAHQSIRRGLEGQCGNVQTLHHEILEHLRSLDPHDSVRMREFGYHCILADDKKTFVDYVQQFKSDQEVMAFLAKDTHDLMLTDHGTWLQGLLRDGMELQAGYQMVNFVNFELYDSFGESQAEMELECRMLEAGLAFAQQLSDRNKTPESRRDLFVSYDRAGEIYEKLGGIRNQQKAFEMYQKGLELSEELSREQGTSESRRDLYVSYEKNGNIYKELGGIKNLEKALGMYQKGLELSEELSREQGTSESRRDLSASCERIGGIYEELGGRENLELALEMYQKAMELSEELSREQEMFVSRRDLSVSYNRAGGIYEELGGRENLEKALVMYQKSLELFKELYREQGTSGSYRDLCVSYNKVGGIYEELGGRENLEKALGMHQKSLELSEELYREQETFVSRRDLSVSYERIGGIYEELGGRENLETALGMYQKGLELSEELSREQGTPGSRRDLSVSCDYVGRIYEELGGRENLEKALVMYQKSLELRKELSREQGTSASRRDLSVSHSKIGNIYKALGGRENLETALVMYRKGMKLSEELSREQGTSGSRRDLSVSCDYVGRIYEELGGRENLEKALEIYQKSLKLREELGREQGTLGSRRDLSVSYDYVGRIYEELGGRENLEKALEMYQKSLELRRELNREQGLSESRRNLSISCDYVGRIYEELGGKENLEKALEIYQKSLELREELSREQGTSGSRRDLSVSCDYVGRIYEELGGRENLEKALEIYQKSLKLREELGREQGTSESRRDLSISYNNVGDIYKELGGRENLEKALSMYQKSLELSEELYREQGTSGSSRDLSISYERIGDIYKELGGRENLEKALGMYQKEMKLCEELSREQGTSGSRRDLSISYNRAGGICEKLGGRENLEKALSMYQKSLELRKELSRDQGTPGSRRDLSISYNKAGGIYEKLGGRENLEKALEMYQKALEISEELSRELKTLSAFDDLAVSYYKLGTHPDTISTKRRKYLEQFLKLSEMLFQQTQNERYEKFISDAKQCLNKI